MSTPRRSTGRVAASRAATHTPNTPQNLHHHHQSADELAVKEAEHLLHPDDPDTASQPSPDVLLSPRARRYAALTAKRDTSIEPTSLHNLVSSPAPRAAIGKGQVAVPAVSSPGTSSGLAPESEEEEATEDVSSDSDGSSASSSDSSDSDNSSDSELEAESDDDSDEDELEAALAAAKATAAASASTKQSIGPGINGGGLGEDDDGEFRFDDEASKEAPIPDLAIPSLPARHLTLSEDGTAHAGEQARPSKNSTGAAPELDRGTYERTLSRREKMAMPKKATVSEMWATIPSARSDDLPQMKRDYQALALSASLDPKRFMKGGNKAGKVPERFAIGTVVDAPRQLQDTTVRKERKYRPGQVVASLITNEGVGTYAKRKFEELQSKRMYNGRGKGWTKRSKW